MLGLQVEAIASGRPLVGRDRELDQLEASLDALGHGSAGCLALEGEAGIGKTRLLRELRRAPSSAVIWCSRARRSNSSARFRSACGWTR